MVDLSTAMLAHVWIVRQFLVQCPGYFLRTLLYKEAGGASGVYRGMFTEATEVQWVNKHQQNKSWLCLKIGDMNTAEPWITRFHQDGSKLMNYIEMPDFQGMNTAEPCLYHLLYHPFLPHGSWQWQERLAEDVELTQLPQPCELTLVLQSPGWGQWDFLVTLECFLGDFLVDFWGVLMIFLKFFLWLVRHSWWILFGIFGTKRDASMVKYYRLP